MFLNVCFSVLRLLKCSSSFSRESSRESSSSRVRVVYDKLILSSGDLLKDSEEIHHQLLPTAIVSLLSSADGCYGAPTRPET